MGTIGGAIELTFAMVKPHIIKHPIALNSIRNMILSADFKIVRSKRHQLQLGEAEKFYSEHKAKFFYNRLVTLMTSGPSDLYILAKYDAIKEWRKLMGPTKVSVADFEAPNSIRGQFGLSDTRNAVHGSDSPASAAREISIMFPEFNIEDWFATEEPNFRRNELQFDEKEFIHIVGKTI